MMHGATGAAALAVLAVLAWHDLRRRWLPNRWVGCYAALFLPYAWLSGLGVAQLGAHLAVAGVGFLCLLILFVLGGMGGGDVKLGTAVLLWAGPISALPALVMITWSGGLLAVAGWLADHATRGQRASPPVMRSAVRALSARRGVPYGVALAGGGLYVLWRHSAFF